MRVLAIETSCDETAISLVEGEGDERRAEFRVAGNALFSQIGLHRPYGGVFPTLAKRAHMENILPLTYAALEEAGCAVQEDTAPLDEATQAAIREIFAHEEGLAAQFFTFATNTPPPPLDAIAVTFGPGLPPALWVGVNFARALARVWGKPLVAVNHMEGHILSALAQKGEENTLTLKEVELPVLALLISGGHTELVVMREWLSYALIGQTRDDAVGEAFDKVARLLDLPYPGGPQISSRAEEARRKGKSFASPLPRPMLNEETADFSFAGLKTAVRYLLESSPPLSDEEKETLAREFEDAVAEVLFAKTVRALAQTHARTLVLGGGVSANTHIRRVFKEKMRTEYPSVSLRIPPASLTTDNAVMIALAGFYHARRSHFIRPEDLAADGNATLARAQST